MSRRQLRRPERRLAAEPLESRRLLAGGPLITELMATSQSGLRDEDREPSDWIEIHNPTAATINLDGWYLTDRPDELARWRLPPVNLGSGEYLVIFASGKDRADPASQLHTNFRLENDGEFLALVQPDGTTVAHQYAPGFPQQLMDISYGLADDLTTQFFFETPTPGARNVGGALGVVATPAFSVERGLFDAPLHVQITSATPEAEIRYTLDGSQPTATTGAVYDGPIRVDGTTTLRGAAFRPDHLSSDVVTHSYLFPRDVLQQPANPDGFPTQWVLEDGEVRPAVYDVIPQVVDYHRDTILSDLRAVATLSLVTDVDEMFGPGCTARRADQACGAYNSGGANIDSPTSVELILPDGRQGFQIDAGIRLQGGSSRMPGVGKRSMRLQFTSDFGPTKLEFPLFDDSPVETFDTIILRANVQDGWGRGAAGERQLIKDEFARRTQLAMGQPSAHGTWAHVYINGLYWGLYNVVERPDASFAAEHLGGDKDDWDTLNGGRLRDGNLQAWDEMIALTPRGGPDIRNLTDEIVATRYEQIQKLLDVEGFIDYLLVGMYMGTEDWLPNNYYAGRRSRDGGYPVDPTDPASKFRFFHWDQERALLGVDKFRNLPGFVSPVGRIFQLLRQSDEFVDLQAQRLYTHLFNGGPLSPEAAAARYQGLVDEVSNAIKGEAIRWGRAPSNVPDWETEARFILDTLIPSRREGVLDQYRRFGLYPEADAPVFSQQGGRFSESDQLVMSAAEGVIYYTIDGTDPRAADGSVSPTAIEYVEPVTLSENTRVRARALAGTEWSVYNQAQFYVGAQPAAGAVAITEIHYHPEDPTPSQLAMNPSWEGSDFEFIEIHNTTSEPIDLTGARFVDGIDFVFPALNDQGQPMRLGPDQYAVLVGNVAAFETRYAAGGTDIFGQYSGRLNNAGERLRLEGPLGTPWQELRFDDEGDWPRQADGQGMSLSRKDDHLPPDVPSNWIAAAPSPGRANSPVVVPGDADGDGHFTAQDIVLVRQAGKYLTGRPASFADGDWNGDGLFDQYDIVAALLEAHFRA